MHHELGMIYVKSINFQTEYKTCVISCVSKVASGKATGFRIPGQKGIYLSATTSYHFYISV